MDSSMQPTDATSALDSLLRLSRSERYSHSEHTVVEEENTEEDMVVVTWLVGKVLMRQGSPWKFVASGTSSTIQDHPRLSTSSRGSPPASATFLCLFVWYQSLRF